MSAEDSTVTAYAPQIESVESIASVDAAVWDRLFDAGLNPCVSHAFLHALEITGCVGEHTGSRPRHLLADDAGGRLAGSYTHLPLPAERVGQQ